MALVLEPTDIATVRALSGDNCAVADQAMTDAVMQEFWNLDSVQDSCDPLMAMVVWALRFRWGKERAAKSNHATGTRVSSANVDQIVDQIAYYESLACMKGAKIQMDMLYLGIDSGPVTIDEWQSYMMMYWNLP